MLSSQLGWEGPVLGRIGWDDAVLLSEAMDISLSGIGLHSQNTWQFSRDMSF